MQTNQYICALRLKSWEMIHEISGYVVSEQFSRINKVLAKYNPAEARVPAGNPTGGQWTSGGGNGGINEGTVFLPPTPQGILDIGTIPENTSHGPGDVTEDFPTTSTREQPILDNTPDGLDQIRSDATSTQYPNDVIEPVYPIEGILVALYAGPALAAAFELGTIWSLGESVIESGGLGEIADAIEEYFDGPPEDVFTNDDGDLIMMGDGKKVRFDIHDPGYKNGLPDDPHFHIEEQMPNGTWDDAGSQHRYYFKKGE